MEQYKIEMGQTHSDQIIIKEDKIDYLQISQPMKDE